MPQFVLVNNVWTRWLSDTMIDLNNKLGSSEGRIVMSQRAATGVLKFAESNLCLDLSAVATDAELAAQKTANAATATPIIDSRTQTVYLYANSTWTAQATGTIKSYIAVGQYYWNATTKGLFFASAVDRLDRIGNMGPAVATQDQVNAGTADNVAVTAAQAKIAWQLWKTQ